jgi:hypothetical protein
MLPPHRPVWLLIVSFLPLIACIGFFDQAMAERLLPLYQQTLHLLLPDSWHISPLQVVQEGREAFISVRVETLASSPLADRLIPAGLGMNGSTLLGHAFQPPLLTLHLLLAWFYISPGRKTGPAVLALLFLLLLESVDVPLVLAGSLWDILHANIAPDSPLPWQVRAMHLLNGGGRQALALAAGLSAITLGSRLQARLSANGFLPGSAVETALPQGKTAECDV